MYLNTEELFWCDQIMSMFSIGTKIQIFWFLEEYDFHCSGKVSFTLKYHS